MRSSRGSIPPYQRYRLGVELGRGGMGRVVEAFDTQLGRTVALKEVLPKGKGVEKRFAREVQITARLEHPAIVPLYDSGTSADGRPFYVMRRVTGRPLDEIIKRAPNLAERLVLLPNVLAAIDAVAHAHRRGVIHRDLKPANILVGELGETVVIDWGLAKVVGEDETDAGVALNLPSAADSLQTQVGSVFGTPGFMAPEQVRGDELGARSDVYALGATLYQLLAGGPPHAGTSATEVLEGTLKHEVLPLAETAPGAPVELVAIVDKALSFEPETRYPNAGALGEDVRRFLAGQLVAAHRYTPRQKIGRFAKRHRAALTIAAGATVVLAVLAWISVSRVLTERDEASAARRAAEIDKRAAESARDRLAERNDTLIVTQARAQVETNPTQALATLKQLDPKSPKIEEAKAVAQAAVMRGSWMAIHSTDEPTVYTELSPDGKQLIQLSRDADKMMLRIWDLERRRLLTSRSVTRLHRMVWIAGNKVLVYSDGAPPEILDPTSRQVTPTDLPVVTYAVADATGMHAVVIDAEKHASLYDVTTRARLPLWEGHVVTDTAIAPDGSWLALVDKQGIVVLDATGKEIGARAGTVHRIAVSDHRRIA
ncbi:MAG: serine/threonine-protein kinase, partial [Polyangiales bacterium]